MLVFGTHVQDMYTYISDTRYSESHICRNGRKTKMAAKNASISVQTSIFLLVVNSTHLKTIISDLLHCLNSTRSTLQLFVSYLYNVRMSSIQAYKSSKNAGYNNTSIGKFHKQLHSTCIFPTVAA